MKGLYLNVEGARDRVERLARTIGAPSAIVTSSHDDVGDVLVDHHPADWPAGPVFEDPKTDLFAAASGWFVFRGGLGDLEGFARSFAAAAGEDDRAQVVRELSAGEYIVLLVVGGKSYIVTDPFGLHPHYAVNGEPFNTIAPSPHYVKGERPQNPVAIPIIEARNHLYGNMTLYEGIERLEPGAVITGQRTERFFDYGARGEALERVPGLMAETMAPFLTRSKVIPLSGGLDSRLLLAAIGADYGYTFGPYDSGDRPVARRYAHLLKDYWEFSLLDDTYPERYRTALATMLDGIVPHPYEELLVINGRLHERWPDASVLLDGYAGDVLQRGTLLTYGGVWGNLAKLLPFITTHDFDPMTVLRGRNAMLSDDQFEVVARTYREKMDGMDLDDMHKVILFETVHGKGGRIAVQGGIMAGQYFTNVRPLYFPSVFRSFFQEDMVDTLNHRTLRTLWRTLGPEYADMPTYSGYTPSGNAHLGRATMLMFKALARLKVGRAVTYNKNLSRTTWVTGPSS